MLYSKKLLCVFVVLLVVSLSPAVAVEMSEVAKEAEKYDKDSKEEMGFFAKVNFISRGFQLVEKAEKAQKEADKIKGKKRSDKNAVELLLEKYNEDIDIQKKLLEFRKSKKETNKNSTNSTNGTNVVVGDVDYVIPHECEDHINLLLQVLGEQGLNITFNHQTEINTSLENHIVQLIDRSGFLRYVIVKKVDLNTDKPTVTVATDKGEKTFTLKDFKKAYTGLVLDTGDSPVDSVLGEILGFQRGELSEEHADMCMLDDKTKSKMINNGLMITLGIALMAIGETIYWYYMIFIHPDFTYEVSAAYDELDRVISVDPTKYNHFLHKLVHRGNLKYINLKFYNFMMEIFNKWSPMYELDPFNEINITPDFLIHMLKKGLSPDQLVGFLRNSGIEYTVRTVPAVTVDTTMGLYIRTVVGIISLILVVTGAIMATYNLNCLFDHAIELVCIKWFLTPMNKVKSELMDGWLDKEFKTLPKPLKPLGVVSVNNTLVSVG